MKNTKFFYCVTILIIVIQPKLIMKGRKLLLRETITLTSGAIMFILGVSALVYVGNDLIVTKFNPDTWGTVSDWVIVLITLITAVLLILTLDSQKQVQEDQEKINKLTIHDLRLKNKPKINIKAINEDDLNREYHTFILSVTNSDVEDLIIFSNSKIRLECGRHSIKNQVYTEKYEYLIKKLSIEKDSTIELHLSNQKLVCIMEELTKPISEHGNDNINVINFEIIYSDKFGFRYRKMFNININLLYKIVNIHSTTDELL